MLRERRSIPSILRLPLLRNTPFYTVIQKKRKRKKEKKNIPKPKKERKRHFFT
jgi:hypothetical protein